MSNIANHSEPFLLKLDIQRFADDLDDVILPDDFDATPPAEEIIENPVEPGDDTIPTEPTDDTKPTDTPKIKVKYNHEEQEFSYDDAIPLVQKGLNYDKLQEKLQSLESDPRLRFVEDLATEQGMTVEEYLEAARQYREQQRLDELVQQNIPEEYAREILENRKFREQLEAERRTKAEEEKRSQEFGEFLKHFKATNDREFDADKDKIPDEVWELNRRGIPLKFAYLQHESNQLRQQVKVLKQNKQNEDKAPVQGVSTHGSQEIASADPFLMGFDSI